ncbi:MAG: macrocin o-methyltransferase, partial [Edafosvirus sp.]
KGLFQNTVPITVIPKIAILRLDGDYYESTMVVLEAYYFNITKGGYIIVDDYNNDFLACKQAVDDFRKKHNITNVIQQSNGAIYWQV